MGRYLYRQHSDFYSFKNMLVIIKRIVQSIDIMDGNIVWQWKKKKKEKYRLFVK